MPFQFKIGEITESPKYDYDQYGGGGGGNYGMDMGGYDMGGYGGGGGKAVSLKAHWAELIAFCNRWRRRK